MDQLARRDPAKMLRQLTVIESFTEIYAQLSELLDRLGAPKEHLLRSFLFEHEFPDGQGQGLVQIELDNRYKGRGITITSEAPVLSSIHPLRDDRMSWLMDPADSPITTQLKEMIEESNGNYPFRIYSISVVHMDNREIKITACSRDGHGFVMPFPSQRNEDEDWRFWIAPSRIMYRTHEQAEPVAREIARIFCDTIADFLSADRTINPNHPEFREANRSRQRLVTLLRMAVFSAGQKPKPIEQRETSKLLTGDESEQQ